MGCINSDRNFPHVFGNIHLSGPCNRACYFCIGQHMMALDTLNNLDTFPLKNFNEFTFACNARGVKEVNVTGSNTDPLLYKHMDRLKKALKVQIPGLKFGLRTNGVLILSRPEIWNLFDKASITICSTDPVVYKQMMGHGEPPDLLEILNTTEFPIKINIVLGPENTKDKAKDLMATLDKLAEMGVRKVNLREPYGQANVGNPLAGTSFHKELRLGMPVYEYNGVEVTYWDVHYVEVESVNLYANGIVSETYPITKGHDPVKGVVIPQSEWTHGRHRSQWQTDEKNSKARLDSESVP